MVVMDHHTRDPSLIPPLQARHSSTFVFIRHYTGAEAMLTQEPYRQIKEEIAVQEVRHVRNNLARCVSKPLVVQSIDKLERIAKRVYRAVRAVS